MPSETLTFTLVQPDLFWEDIPANLAAYELLLQNVAPSQVLVLPEMFSTGFSMNPGALAEPMNGPTVQWMTKIAAEKKCIVTGSLIIEEDGHFYNRMIWMQPNGTYGFYDKRHLFAFAGEDRQYTPGNKRLLVSVGGWRLCLTICYDLRFPVWLRNTGKEQYDVLVVVANWPERRSLAWKTLLQARAIENQSYVVGVNRVGTDGNGILHSGDSSVFDPLGNLLWQETGIPRAHSITIRKSLLTDVRHNLPFLKDADEFVIL